jgi:hypothetical protein
MTPKTKINYLLQAGLIVFFLLPLLFAGCSAPEKRLEKKRLTLVYRLQSGLESEIKELRLEHPIEISREQVMNHLLSLHYEELSLMGKGKYVFSPDDALEITPLVTKALNRIKANTILYYEVDTPHGTTAGSIFRAKGKIHWRFKIIKGSDFANSSFPGHRGSTWRLVPRGGQSFRQINNLFGSRVQENWIVSGLDLPAKSQRSLRSRSSQKSSRDASPAPKRKRTESSSTDQGELEKRLQFLKGLRDKELIDDNEYERKRKELLDQFL